MCQKLKLEIKALVTVCHQHDNIFLEYDAKIKSLTIHIVTELSFATFYLNKNKESLQTKPLH